MGSGLTKTIAVIVPALSLAVAGCYPLTQSQESITEPLSGPQKSPAELLSVPQESPTERMNRLCESCGVTSDEFDKLIRNVQRVEIKRRDAIGLFKLSFRERGEAEVCAACAEAIMAVVDEMSERQ